MNNIIITLKKYNKRIKWLNVWIAFGILAIPFELIWAYFGRGYFAVGGEVALGFYPLMIYSFIKIAKEIK